MSDCLRFRDLLAAKADGDLDSDHEREMELHVESCADCRGLAAALTLVGEAASAVAEMIPPAALASDLGASGCRRWQTLLFQAVDREISDESLDRLLIHLESCEACSSLWADLTLVHQVSECIEPPPHLLQRCVWGIKKTLPMPVIGRRAAIAVAYILTVLATLVVGNPVTLAKNPAAETLRSVAGTVSEEVASVTDDGRGEFRVMLWRAWSWTATKAASARDLIDGLNDDTDTTTDKGDQT